MRKLPSAYGCCRLCKGAETGSVCYMSKKPYRADYENATPKQVAIALLRYQPGLPGDDRRPPETSAPAPKRVKNDHR